MFWGKNCDHLKEKKKKEWNTPQGKPSLKAKEWRLDGRKFHCDFYFSKKKKEKRPVFEKHIIFHG